MKSEVNMSGLAEQWKCTTVVGALAVALSVLPAVARAADGHEHHHHHHHHHAEMVKALNVVDAGYVMPEVKMTRADGVQRDFAKDIDAGGPVVLNFIYTSCTAICPMSSQVFSSFQQKLGDEAAKVKLVSVSIDPEYDTPARLAAYARKYNAGANWTFYTGSLKNSIAVQKAFDAYRGDKMNHVAVTFMRKTPNDRWVRIEGMAGADELLQAYRGLGQAVPAGK